MKNAKPTSRRDFLKTAVVLPAAVAALPATAMAEFDSTRWIIFILLLCAPVAVGYGAFKIYMALA